MLLLKVLTDMSYILYSVHIHSGCWVSAIIYKTLLLPHENEFTDVQRQNCVIKRDGRARARPHCAPAAALFSRLIALAANFLPKIGSKNVFEKHGQIKSASASERATLLRRRAFFYLERYTFGTDSCSRLYFLPIGRVSISPYATGQKSMGHYTAFAI